MKVTSHKDKIGMFRVGTKVSRRTASLETTTRQKMGIVPKENVPSVTTGTPRKVRSRDGDVCHAYVS